MIAVGTQGQCEGAVPTGATGVALNITASDASQATFLTIWPAGDERPNASSLNPAPGQPPTPNAVTTDLNDAGEFAVYNRFGSVHVLADIVGYYTDHRHDDRYYTRAEVDAAVAAATAPKADASAVYTRVEADQAIVAAAPRVRKLSRTDVRMEMFDQYQKVAELGTNTFRVDEPVWVLLQGMVEMHHQGGTDALPITVECYASATGDSGVNILAGPAKMEVFGESNHDAYINMPLNGGAWVEASGDYDVEIWCHRNWPTNYAPARSTVDAVEFAVEIVRAPVSLR